MSIATWLAKIIPSFGNKDLQLKIRNVASKNSEFLQPIIAQFYETFKSTQLSDVLAVRLTNMHRNVVGQRDADVFVAMSIVSDNIDKLTSLLEDYSKKHFTTQINVEALTFQQASVLKLIDIMDFVVDYSVRALNQVTAAEISKVAFDKASPATKAEQKFLDDNLNGYLEALKVLKQEPKYVMQEIEKIPSIIVINTETSEVPGLQGHEDPLKLDAIPVISKVFYWWAIRKVDADLAKYERLKKIRRNVEFRIEALRSKNAGEEPNARVESTLEKYEREVLILSDKIRRLEEA